MAGTHNTQPGHSRVCPEAVDLFLYGKQLKNIINTFINLQAAIQEWIQNLGRNVARVNDDQQANRPYADLFTLLHLPKIKPFTEKRSLLHLRKKNFTQGNLDEPLKFTPFAGIH